MGEGKRGSSDDGDGFEKDPDAYFLRAFAPGWFRRRPDRYTFTTGGPHPRRVTISGTRFRTLTHAQLSFPVPVLRAGDATWWAFRGTIYRDDRGHDARAVRAILARE